jgi:hypothetical protein
MTSLLAVDLLPSKPKYTLPLWLVRCTDVTSRPAGASQGISIRGELSQYSNITEPTSSVDINVNLNVLLTIVDGVEEDTSMDLTFSCRASVDVNGNRNIQTIIAAQQEIYPLFFNHT